MPFCFDLLILQTPESWRDIDKTKESPAAVDIFIDNKPT